MATLGESIVSNAHEHAAAGAATAVSLALPIDLEHWAAHVATSVFVGVCTWAVTHAIKAAVRFVRSKQ